MRILSLGLDNSVLNKESLLAQKTCEYGELIEKYYMIVPADSDRIVDLSEKVRVYGVSGCCRALKLWKMLALAKGIVKKYKCDVVTSQDPFELGFIARRLQRKYKIAWNAQEHGDFFSQNYWRRERLLHFFRYYLGKFLIKKTDSIRVVSKRTKEFLVNNLCINKEKIVVVPVLTEFVDSQETEQVIKKERGGFVFLNLGRFVKQKNLPMLLRAFAKVNKKYPNTSLYLIGKGPLKADLQLMIKQYKLESSVVMKDWVDNMYDYFLSADAYVLSSNYEGWGRVIVEAAATKLPIIMTDVGCAGELVCDDESALVLPVGDEEKFAEAMIKIIKNEELRTKLSESAFLNYKKLANKKETLELYKESWKKALSLSSWGER